MARLSAPLALEPYFDLTVRAQSGQNPDNEITNLSDSRLRVDEIS